MNRANIFKTITIACLFFALCVGNVSGALPEERPGAFAMVIDVPIRLLSLGLTMVGTAFFILFVLIKCYQFRVIRFPCGALPFVKITK